MSELKSAQLGTYQFNDLAHEIDFNSETTPKFRWKPSLNITIVEGQSVKLRCRISKVSAEGAEYEWFKNGKPISTLKSYHQKMRVKKMRYLKIKRTTPQDGGTYTCVTKNSCGTLKGMIELVVRKEKKAPPKFVNLLAMNRTSRTYREGGKAALKCEATGDPQPVIKWTKPDNLHLPHERNPYDYVLNLRALGPQHSGSYTCNVSNTVGWLTYTYKITVNCGLSARIAPRINSITNNQTVTTGRKTWLMCTILYKEYDDTLRLNWFFQKNGTKEKVDSKFYRNSTLPNHYEDVLLRVEFFLEFHRVNKDNEGWYICHAENKIGLHNTKRTYLRVLDPVVTEPPKIIVDRAQRRERTLILVPVGNSIKMDCSAIGYPRPTVKWYKNGRLYTHSVDGPIYLSPYQYVLSLRNVVPGNSGVYTCNVSNHYGWFNHTYKVDVRVRVRAKPVIQKMENVTAFVGTNATLICKAMSDSMPHFQWIRWFLPIFNTTTNITTQPYDVVKQTPSDDSRLIIVSKDSYKLIFVNITKSEQGKYTCLVGNAVGYDTEHVYLKVVTPEVLSKTTNNRRKPEPPKRREKTLLVVSIGNPIRMDCSASGYPRPTVKWYKNGRSYKVHSVHGSVFFGPYQYVLRLTNAVLEDSGVYTCNVSNTFGWFEHTFEVNVTDRALAKPVLQKMKNVTALLGARAIIKCQAMSDSKPHFQWLHWLPTINTASDNVAKKPAYEVIKKTPSRYNRSFGNISKRNGNLTRTFYVDGLIIEKVTQSQLGKYTCLAGNDVGYDFQHAYLISS
ncbi:Hemicentin-2 [Exaiptasia diaphana]|nr:Hemicentin-2 [Exaiptasia diaphana]